MASGDIVSGRFRDTEVLVVAWKNTLTNDIDAGYLFGLEEC
jgi:hypothetical protein